MRSLYLTLLPNGSDKSLAGMLAPVDVRVVEACVPHELAEEASISGQTGDDDSHVVIDFKDVLLRQKVQKYILCKKSGSKLGVKGPFGLNGA